MKNEMISFGAGVNSVAMTILLVNEGWRGPIVFADPGAEHPDTYCYIEYFEREWLRPRGLEVTRLSPMLTPMLYGSSYRMGILERHEKYQVVPRMLQRACTTEWKRRPLVTWAQKHDIAIMYLGIAAEESHRARFSHNEGIPIEYPLIDRRINREQCKEIIQQEDLSIPPKSGCWFCPFQRLAEWRALYDLRPDLFDRAVNLEIMTGERCGKPIKLAEGCRQSVANLKRMWDAQLELPLMPEPEYEYQMCECRL